MLAVRPPGAKYRAAIFDMDGLLLDSERPIRDAPVLASLLEAQPNLSSWFQTMNKPPRSHRSPPPQGARHDLRTAGRY
jgi:phosphoglycolate phosphatase-like HAD superfamily hydrolase